MLDRINRINRMLRPEGEFRMLDFGFAVRPGKCGRVKPDC